MHDSILKVTVGCTFLKEVQPGDDDTSTVLTDDHGGADQVLQACNRNFFFLNL